jgi:NADP-dependent 3-hydroxy acid dehydrogenase YdfG
VIRKPFQKHRFTEAFSTIDILINNAGTLTESIQNGDLDDWDAMIDINVKGCFQSHHPMIERVILSTSVPLLQKKFIKRECILCYKTCG